MCVCVCMCVRVCVLHMYVRARIGWVPRVQHTLLPAGMCLGLGGARGEQGSGSHSSAEMEKHKIKEQQRRAKKRQLLSTLQSIVLGEAETNSKATGITGNYILELVVVQLEKERIETAGGAAPAAIAAVKTEFC
mmetsp:Transcript_1803/g.2466  ORF Transcript_1803/g.2466 Transcript_1803/m.2466 type:complete len:134 (+) Transcript_1803:225-626(+)